MKMTLSGNVCVGKGLNQDLSINHYMLSPDKNTVSSILMTFDY